MLINTDVVQVHYERAQNIVGSGTKMTMRRTEYLARINISNGLYRMRWGGKGLFMSGNNIFSSTIKEDFKSR
jgi:hypothetical protein